MTDQRPDPDALLRELKLKEETRTGKLKIFFGYAAGVGKTYAMLHPGLWLFNPGSVSIPKDGTHSYGIYEDGAFRHVILEEE